MAGSEYTSSKSVKSCLGEKLLKLKHSTFLSDVTVCRDGPSIRAHKCILSASSLYFKSVFTSEESAGDINVVDLSNERINCADLDAVIDYMYTGCVNVTVQNLSGIVDLALFLECTDLLDVCVEFADDIANDSNCLTLFQALHRLWEDTEDYEYARVARIHSRLLTMMEDGLSTDGWIEGQINEVQERNRVFNASQTHTRDADLMRKRVADIVKAYKEKKMELARHYKWVLKYKLMVVKAERESATDKSSLQLPCTFVADGQTVFAEGQTDFTEGQTDFTEGQSMFEKATLKYETINKEENIVGNHYDSDTDNLEDAKEDEEKAIEEMGQSMIAVKPALEPAVDTSLRFGAKLCSTPLGVEQSFVPRRKSEAVDTSETGKLMFKCSHCDKTFTRKTEYQQHILKHTGSLFKCNQCDKTFTRKSGYQKHRLIHTGSRPFTCTECGRGFITKCKLKQHKERVHIGVVGIGCEKCGLKFSDQAHLENHSQQCEGRKLACEVCGKKFLYQVSLDRHAVSHSDARPHPCNQCPRTFKHAHNLKAHVLLKHQNIDKVTQQSVCDHCGKVLKNRNCLRRHLLTHQSEQPYKCPQCPKSYTQSTGLEVHMRTHSGQRPYQCEICSAMFTVKCNLDRHIQRHLGTKPHTCPTCNKSFVQITDLKRHQTVHSGEKKFSCSFCGKLFALKKSVAIHERIHTGVRPYKCGRCRKSFATTSDLRRHEKTHLKDKMSTRSKHADVNSGLNNDEQMKGGSSRVVGVNAGNNSYQGMETRRDGYQPTGLVENRSDGLPPENPRPFMSAFSSGIGFY